MASKRLFEINWPLTSLPIYLCKVQYKIKMNLSFVIYEQKWNIVHGFYFLVKYLQKKEKWRYLTFKTSFRKKVLLFQFFYYFLVKYLQKKKSEDYLTFKSLLGRRFCYYLIGSRKSLGKLLAQCKPTFYHYHKTQICNLRSIWLWPLS